MLAGHFGQSTAGSSKTAPAPPLLPSVSSQRPRPTGPPPQHRPRPAPPRHALPNDRTLGLSQPLFQLPAPLSPDRTLNHTGERSPKSNLKDGKAKANPEDAIRKAPKGAHTEVEAALSGTPHIKEKEKKKEAAAAREAAGLPPLPPKVPDVPKPPEPPKPLPPPPGTGQLAFALI